MKRGPFALTNDELPTGRGAAAARHIVRHVAVIGLAGAITGVIVGGLGGRLMMRVSALLAPDDAVGMLTESANVVGEITLELLTKLRAVQRVAIEEVEHARHGVSSVSAARRAALWDDG